MQLLTFGRSGLLAALAWKVFRAALTSNYAAGMFRIILVPVKVVSLRLDKRAEGGSFEGTQTRFPEAPRRLSAASIFRSPRPFSRLGWQAIPLRAEGLTRVPPGSGTLQRDEFRELVRAAPRTEDQEGTHEHQQRH